MDPTNNHYLDPTQISTPILPTTEAHKGFQHVTTVVNKDTLQEIAQMERAGAASAVD